MRRALIALALAATVPFCRDARAADTVLAESLFRQGRSLMDKGEYATACPRLSESYAQDPSTGTLLALAFCQEKLGQTASAWASYAEVVTRSKREGHLDREEAARERARALEPKLSRLTIEVSEGAATTPGLIVTRDGHAVGQGAWGAATPLDPGDHVITAKAPGKEAWSQTVTIATESDAQKIIVPALMDLPLPAASPAAEPLAEKQPGSQPFFNGSPLQTIGLVTAGVGVAGLAASAVFGLRASSLNSESNENGHCTDATGCDDVGFSKREDARSAAGTATIFLIAGAGLTATGATLFIIGSSKPKQTARLDATPIIGPGVAAMSLRGRF